MSQRNSFSLERLWALVVKEFIQMRRDRVTFGMMIGIPLIQLILFALAINSDPKHLPTAVFLQDHGPLGRSLMLAMKNSSYFDFVREVHTEEEARNAIARGEVQFLLNIPLDFSRNIIRGESPAILVEADATDPSATSNAIASLQVLLTRALAEDLKGSLSYLTPSATPFELRVHACYNPEAITQYNIVPGLMGVVLTMTMVMITALAITRERERGTMENLLSMPARPLEVMIGKIIPYIIVGYIQASLLLAAASLLFHVPVEGSIVLLYAVMFLFIAANLAVGITFSTVSTNQLQAMQMSFFFFLPSLLLSGFMFPFRGMPVWAQNIGSIFPLTHFLRIVRGILLKGNGPADITADVWPMAVFLVIVLIIGVKRYRQTLD